MYLVDTSVWIDFLRNKTSAASAFTRRLLSADVLVGITEHIYLEILQGASNESSFQTLSEYFSGQRFYAFENSRESYAEAAHLYMACRQRGVTIRSSMDCLIAQTALEHDLVLIHQDRDFLALAEVSPNLKQQHFLD